MMAFWNRWFRKEESKLEPTQPSTINHELITQWVQSINDSLIGIKEELQKIPAETAATLNESSERDRDIELLKKLDDLPDKITGSLKEIISIYKQEILAELVRIGSHYDAHRSHDSISAVEKPIQEVTKALTGKQRKLLATLLDSGFLSYAEIGEKLGITHESAKNFVNRLVKDEETAKLFSKQETDRGVIVGISSKVQDEILEKKHRTTSNDSE